MAKILSSGCDTAIAWPNLSLGFELSWILMNYHSFRAIRRPHFMPSHRNVPSSVSISCDEQNWMSSFIAIYSMFEGILLLLPSPNIVLRAAADSYRSVPNFDVDLDIDY
jgi:hypothetical protein